MAALGLCCCMWAFPSCKEQGLLSSWDAVASVCGGFSWEARAVGLGLSHCAPGLCRPVACGSAPDQGANWCPCIAKQTQPLGHQGPPIQILWMSALLICIMNMIICHYISQPDIRLHWVLRYSLLPSLLFGTVTFLIFFITSLALWWTSSSQTFMHTHSNWG